MSGEPVIITRELYIYVARHVWLSRLGRGNLKKLNRRGGSVARIMKRVRQVRLFRPMLHRLKLYPYFVRM